LFEAALGDEEAVYNSLFQATTVRLANGAAEAIPSIECASYRSADER
jgi:hypothetical protein